MTSGFVPVILAGGSGTRLWPMSRELYPKQFLRLVGKGTMLQQTLARLAGLSHDPPVVVCNQDHRFIVAEQCAEIGVEPGAIVLEPAPRNTAPAVALAALRALHGATDPLLLVMPADHHIESVAGFRTAVRQAVPYAEKGGIVTFGITPTRPETGYGYIKAGEPESDDAVAAHVTAFAEKPGREVAERHLAEGGWYWNSGLFLMRADVYLEELERHRPDIHGACAAAVAAQRRDLDFVRPGDAFNRCAAESLDRAVMEKTRRALVVPTDMGWSDIGTWEALAATLQQDPHGNTSEGDVIAIDSQNCHLSGRDRLVAAIGVNDLVVVETPDAVLVADKARTQEVTLAVRRLRDGSRSEHRSHTTDHRPWGRAEILNEGDGFRVKRLTVTPGKSLSLQMHRHRSEHWVVVSGEAHVQRGDDRLTLAADESIYIPVGTRHRLANPASAPLVVIEVQTGSLISEDDIVRFDDPYART